MHDPERLAFLSKGGVFGSETVSDRETKSVGKGASDDMPARKPLMECKVTHKRKESGLIQKTQRSEERKWGKRILPGSNVEPSRDVCEAQTQEDDPRLITSDDSLTDEQNARDTLSQGHNPARRPLFEALDSLVKRLEGKTKSARKIPKQDRLGSKSSKSPSDQRGFLDFISVEIKLNKEMLITELEKEGFLKMQEPDTNGVESDEQKAVDASECSTVSDRLRHSIGGDANNDSSGIVTLAEARTQSTSGFTEGFCAEFVKQRNGFMAERARNELTDVVGRRSGSGVKHATNTDICGELMYRDESIHVTEEDGKWWAPRKTRYLLGAPSEALSWINKQIRATHKSVLGKDKRRYDVDNARGQNRDGTQRHSNGETARKESSDRRKTESSSRPALWQAKRAGVRDPLGERLVEFINEKRHKRNENDPVKARKREKTKDAGGFPGRSSQKVLSFTDVPIDKQFKVSMVLN